MSKISLIIQREYNQRVRKRSFILTTIITPLLLVAIMVVPILMAGMSSSDTKTIVVTDESGKIAEKLTNDGNANFINTDQSYQQASAAEEYKDAYGFLVIGSNVVSDPSDLKLYTRGSSTMTLEGSITRQISSIVEQERIESFNIPQLDSIMHSVHARALLTTYQISAPGELGSGDSGSEKASSSAASMAIAYLTGFMIYLFIFLYGAMVMQGVIEEKSSRIIEVIVSSVRPFQLMMGKIIGIALVAVTQVFIWIVLIGVFFAAAQATFLADVLADPSVVAQSTGMMGDQASQIASNLSPQTANIIRSIFNPGYIFALLGGFLVFFVGGYLLYAAMFAAIGSAVDNAADTQQLQLPLTIPLILAMLVMVNVMQNPHSAMAFWFSIIPFTSPIVMMARLPYGVPIWEFALSATLLYGTFLATTWLAGKIYRVGIFMYGKKPSLKELIKWLRYKS